MITQCTHVLYIWLFMVYTKVDIHYCITPVHPVLEIGPCGMMKSFDMHTKVVRLDSSQSDSIFTCTHTHLEAFLDHFWWCWILSSLLLGPVLFCFSYIFP